MPLVGDDLARALSAGTEAGASLADAGRAQVLTWRTWPSGRPSQSRSSPRCLWCLCGWWCKSAPPAARSALIVRTADTDLLALRAMVHLPVRRLLAVSDDPAVAWRRDDRDVVRGLAALELRSLGLRPPRTPPD